MSTDFRSSLLSAAALIQPESPLQAVSSLASSLAEVGEPVLASQLLTQCLRQVPPADSRAEEVALKLGDVLVMKAESENDLAAKKTLKSALSAAPTHADAHFRLGLVYSRLHKPERAKFHLELSLEFEPENLEAWGALAQLFLRHDQIERGVHTFEKARKLYPKNLKLLGSLASVFGAKGNMEEALAVCNEACLFHPLSSDAANQRGIFERDCGRVEEALLSFRQAIALNTESRHSWHALLMTLCYQESLSGEALLREHQNWASCLLTSLQGSPQASFTFEHLRSSTSAPLKIGYLSPDLRWHSVAYFADVLLTASRDVELCVFSDCQEDGKDGNSKRLEGVLTKKFGREAWEETHKLSDADLASLIYSKNVHILVDLAGHSGNNRLQVFARKPAPIQVTMIGYPFSTGLPSSIMDFRIGDLAADPPGTEKFFSETLVRLPNSFLCYSTPPLLGKDDVLSIQIPEASPCSQREGGKGVVFGCFNTLAKLSPSCIKTWSSLLKAVPGSSLLLKSKALLSEGVTKEIQGKFLLHGIPPSRVQCMGMTPHTSSHLSLYNSVDIGLDPWPYGGTTTSCEALWMGVPLLTLSGKTHQQNVTSSLLKQLEGVHEGVEEDMVAMTEEELVEKGVALAGDLKKLNFYRKNLRRIMEESALCDRSSYTSHIEEAYEKMWRDWVETRKKPRLEVK